MRKSLLAIFIADKMLHKAKPAHTTPPELNIGDYPAK